MTIEEIIALIVPLTSGSIPVSAETPVLSSGMLDSYRFAAFLQKLRARAGVEVEVDDIGVDNFDTPAQILTFLRARL